MILISLMASTAVAAGFYSADSGILPNAQGGTGVTGFASPFAVYYNPAGLSRIDRPMLSVGASGNVQWIDFARADADGTVQPVASNAGKPLAIPEFGFAMPVVDDKLYVSFGFTSPTAPDYSFPADGGQRYSMIDSIVWNFQLGPAIAWKPHKMVTVGVGLQWAVLRIEQHLTITTNGRTDGSGDVDVVAAVWDKFTPGANAGVVVEPIEDKLRFGASFQPSLGYSGRGSGQLDFTGNGLEGVLDQVVWTDDDIGLDIRMPAVIRAGVAVRPAPPLELSGEFVWETWSAISEILIKDIDVTVTGLNGGINQAVPEQIPLPAGFEDAWSARLGAELGVHERLTVRLGGLYETSSLSPQSVSAALVDTPKVQGSVGGTVWGPKDRFAIDFYATATAYRHLTITDSTVTQVVGFEGIPPAIVGNGDLRASGAAGGAALRVFFGPPPEEARPVWLE